MFDPNWEMLRGVFSTIVIVIVIAAVSSTRVNSLPVKWTVDDKCILYTIMWIYRYNTNSALWPASWLATCWLRCACAACTASLDFRMCCKSNSISKVIAMRTILLRRFACGLHRMASRPTCFWFEMSHLNVQRIAAEKIRTVTDMHFDANSELTNRLPEHLKQEQFTRKRMGK